MVGEQDHLFNFKDQRFILAPEKALYWKERKALLLADLHLGKSGHFRKAGIPVSNQVNNENLKRLRAITDHYNPETIFFLGDLFHSDKNLEWITFSEYRQAYPDIEMILILGNHDFYAVSEYERLGLKCFESLSLDKFELVHDVPDISLQPDKLYIGGHIHPSVKLKGKGRQSLHAPCFFFSDKKILLPAFGNFTGTHKIKPSKKDRVFPVIDGKVIQLTH